MEGPRQANGGRIWVKLGYEFNPKLTQIRPTLPAGSYVEPLQIVTMLFLGVLLLLATSASAQLL